MEFEVVDLSTPEPSTADLRDRLQRAVTELEGLRAETPFRRTQDRLGGKIEGVKLALSYLDGGERIAVQVQPQRTYGDPALLDDVKALQPAVTSGYSVSLDEEHAQAVIDALVELSALREQVRAHRPGVAPETQPPGAVDARTLTGGLRIETRPVPTTGLVLPTTDGEAFVDYETLEALTEVSVTDLAFESVQGPYVDHAAAKALVAAGLARQSTRGSYYGTDALKALLQEA